MIKYICLPTQHGNVCIIKIDLTPVLDNNGVIIRYTSPRKRSMSIIANKLPLIPGGFERNKVFDSVEEASIYAETLFNKNKDNILVSIDKQFEKLLSRKNKISKLQFKIRKFNTIYG